MKYIILLYLGLHYVNDICCQSFDLKLNVLNDSLFYQRQDGSYYTFFGYINDTIFIDTTVNFELINSSKQDYCLLLDTSHIMTHSIFYWDNQNELKLENNYHINAVLYDSENDSIIGSSGGFISFDIEEMDQVGLDSVLTLDSAESYQLIIIRSLEKLKFNIRFIVPYFDGIHYINKYSLSKLKKYYLKFYLCARSKNVKKVMPKTELKRLKNKNIKIYNGDVLTSKQIPIINRKN